MIHSRGRLPVQLASRSAQTPSFRPPWKPASFSTVPLLAPMLASTCRSVCGCAGSGAVPTKRSSPASRMRRGHGAAVWATSAFLCISDLLGRIKSFARTAAMFCTSALLSRKTDLQGAVPCTSALFCRIAILSTCSSCCGKHLWERALSSFSSGRLKSPFTRLVHRGTEADACELSNGVVDAVTVAAAVVPAVADAKVAAGAGHEHSPARMTRRARSV
mmetsp:Transcript_35448/g.70069  ORF Transcript_35448/g.70069 Transcript_35448/m.70069 type:complete len:218 (+) Transcript_35448:485-1138(+)